MIEFVENNIFYNGITVIENIQLSTRINDVDYKAELKESKVFDNKMKLCFEVAETGMCAELLIEKNENGILFWFSGKIVQKDVWPPIKVIDEEYGYVLSITTKTTDGILARYMENPCWSYAAFNPYQIPQYTQSLLIKNEDVHMALIPICTEKFKTQIISDKCNEIKICMGADEGGYTDNEGQILSVAIGKDPFESVTKAINNCYSSKFFKVPLKKDKDIPMLMEGLGWCTWDACYFEVTHDKIISKVEEFKQKNIKLNWVLIDDGWFEFSENRLQSIYADKNKFPEGLSKTVEILKEEYSVKYVGVWHSFNGYWYGIDENSNAYKENKDFLIKTKAGVIVPDFTNREKAFGFFDKWHAYLKSEGIDFLKVDCQGILARFSKYNMANPEAVRNIQEALEASIRKHFSGNVINCMAMGMEHTQSREYSNMLRNSEDFWPKRPHSFKKHLVQNIYNSVFLDDLYFLDFDMWWTDNEFATQSAVLRAISGGPIYVSDEINATNPEVLYPLLNPDGSFPVCDGAAKPVEQMLYYDYVNNNSVIKVMNNAGEASVLALFNAEHADRELTVNVTYSDIKIKNADEYIVYAYFEKKFYKMTKSTKLQFKLPKKGVEILNFYPIKDDYIMLGDTSKYISSACNPTRITVTDICVNSIGK